MSVYSHFLGIDIGKFHFVVSIHGQKQTKTYQNKPHDIIVFIKDYKDILHSSLCVLEATGGYERDVLFALCKQGFAVHRANARHVKNFIRSFGNKAKTDNLDAQALSFYGYERKDRLNLFKPPARESLELAALVQRRHDLVDMLVCEKNRLKGPGLESTKKSYQIIIDALSQERESIEEQIQNLIKQNHVLHARKEMLKTIPGIGEITAIDLLALLPELGQLNQKEVACLAGVAPRSNDSGTKKGYRHTTRGRSTITSTLFMAAMAARRSHSQLATFYENLIKRGKKKMVALVAVMRKIIVIANARLKNLQHG